jgi:hypothetical protein
MYCLSFLWRLYVRDRCVYATLISSLGATMTDVPAIITLAALTVKGGQLVSSSSGVTYDAKSGIVVFPNPWNLRFVPIVSDTANGTNDYTTTTNFIKEIGPAHQFRVWATPLDTGNRNFAPTDFAAIVVGF